MIEELAPARTRDEIATPALVIDLDVLEANLDDMAAACAAAGKELLPHAKTHRMPELGKMQLDRGAAGLTLAKLGEAEAFADAGVDRIFVAYPLVGGRNIERAWRLSARIDLTLAVDDAEQAERLGAYFAARGGRVDVHLLVDTGMHREGVTGDAVAGLAHAVSRMPGVRVVGIATHEGSVYSAADDVGVAAASIEVAAVMTDAAAACAAAGVPLPVVSMGSSASVRSVLGVDGVTQVRPGIYALNDVGQLALGQVTVDQCAARVLTTVVSHPEPGRACIDAGSKTLSRDLVPAAGSVRYPGHGLVLDAPGWQIAQLSEEHGWLRWVGEGPAEPLPIGRRLTVVPNHICTVFSCLGKATVLRGDRVVDVWLGLGAGASE